ncbi:MAG: heme NO-binding domain-containing protein [Pseudomonadota bacterium]|nr:heme NO-binding domain-containing protein [Pseudomonadota bacterium]
MKGIVFTTFNDMIEEKIGIEVWDRILDTVNPESGGVYTAVEDFPDEELLAMVAELSEITGTPVMDLVRAFGLHLFHALNMKHSIFVESEPDFISFLKSIEDVIHKEVIKLYPNPNLPSRKWEQPDDNSITLFYRSPRQLCSLAEGLIKGAAEQYEVEYTMKHDVCTHNGDDHCRFEISVQ